MSAFVGQAIKNIPAGAEILVDYGTAPTSQVVVFVAFAVTLVNPQILLMNPPRHLLQPAPETKGNFRHASEDDLVL